MKQPQQLLDANGNQPSGRVNLDPDKAEEGLSQLVMTVIELIRQLVERQAMKRVEGGNLTDEEVEKLGIALMNLEEKMEELKEIFGLDDDDLNIDLGPLGNLL
ncbi:gas vesicle protein K [Sediminibacillus massiliensis]|uniref:gas vesicle protein K n=1 Tax=Sediminibacillus massiliensis TaxID=1926277 RepID=UPI000988482E|nr:gas vesicle protein K [Sediminibacillus massiliensis]